MARRVVAILSLAGMVTPHSAIRNHPFLDDELAGLPAPEGRRVHAYLPLANYTVIGVQTDAVATFLGIPYAAPPVGDLRWRSPQPSARPPHGTLQATQARPNCIQPMNPALLMAHPEWGGEGAWPSLGVGLGPSGHPSEDCLYLNVFAPAGAMGHTPQLRPVMVWLCGGGSMYGGQNDAMIDGRALAVEADAIVVVPSHRLGILGAAWSDLLGPRNEDPSTPSLLLQDQRAALRWVQGNIAGFGGDPGRVTLAGESSAAGDVFHHVQHPKSFGLFHRAMMSSGGDLVNPSAVTTSTWSATPGTPSWQAKASSCFESHVRDAVPQCRRGLWGQVDLDCLLEAPADVLDPAGTFAGCAWDLPATVSTGWVFDSSLPRPEVQVLLGFNRDDAQFDLGDGATDFRAPQMGLAGVKGWLAQNYYGFGPRIFAAYRQRAGGAGAVERQGIPAPFPSAVQIASDEKYVCPAMDVASVLSAAGIDTYLWRFDVRRHTRFLLCSHVTCDGSETPRALAMAGACHGCDIPFWFRQDVFLRPDTISTSKAMARYVANFLHTGDPNKGLHVETPWPLSFRRTGAPPKQAGGFARLSEQWTAGAPPAASADVGYMNFGGKGRAASAERTGADQHFCAMWHEWQAMVGTRKDQTSDAFWHLAALAMLPGLLGLAVAWHGAPARSCCPPRRTWKACRPWLWWEQKGEHADGVELAESVLEGPATPYPQNASVHSLFQQGAAAHSGVVALLRAAGTEPGREVTYADLLQLVVAATVALRAAGAGEGQTVPVVVHRGVHLVVAVLGVLGAGAAFVAVAVEAPDVRKQEIVSAVGAAVQLVEVGVAVPGPSGGSSMPAVLRMDTNGRVVQPPRSASEAPAAPGSCPSCGEAAAMVVFTSGSTGRPKGVTYSQEFLLHGVWFYRDLVGMVPGHRALLKSPHIWAVTEYELFPPLLTGGTILVARPEGHKQPAYLAEMIGGQGLDSVMITPRVLDAVLDVLRRDYPPRHAFSLRNCVCVGEPLRADVVVRFQSRFGGQARIHNMYGPTEASCTVWSSPPAALAHQGNVLAGVPQPHTVVCLMGEGSGTDRSVQVVPAGEVGEIYIGGVVASGYLGNAEETAARFVALPGRPGMFYKTGDMGKVVAGQLQVLGRCDRQLNVAGVRVEPCEVEGVIRQCAQESCVVAVGEPERLVVVCVAGNSGAASTERVRRVCSENLPPYMVPEAVLWAEQLPTLPSGKVDVASVRDFAQRAIDEDAESTVEYVDSLGVVRHLNKDARRWQSATWACYAYWSYGVIVDHWMQCSQRSAACEAVLFMLPNWAELVLRSVGNVQDLCGFLMVGALNDAMSTKKGHAVLGRREAIVWAAHLLTFAAIPLVDLLTPWQPEYPNVKQANVHRWYLWMYVLARALLHVFTRSGMTPAAQVALLLLACHAAPKSGVLDACAALDQGSPLHRLVFFLFPSYCESLHVSAGTSAARQLDVPRGGERCTCAVTGKFELLYIAMYLAFFHTAPRIKEVAQAAPLGLLAVAWALIVLLALCGQATSAGPMGDPYLAAELLVAGVVALAFCCRPAAGTAGTVPWPILLGTCAVGQLVVAAFFYAQRSLEEGDLSLERTPLEIAVSTLTPVLFLAAMLQLHSDPHATQRRCSTFARIQAFVHGVGQSALLCYLLHYYFMPSGVLAMHSGSAFLEASVSQPAAGVLQLGWALVLPALFLAAVSFLQHKVVPLLVNTCAQRAASALFGQ